ncbi:MAG: tetratricopeptide repeat protein [Methanoregulaceae archaeon]|nr:tetratricopeptide repeat protein [Methanoregulaceae archaeon]
MVHQGTLISLPGNGGYDAAIGCYNTSLAIDPALTTTWLAKGVALHNLGRYEEAIDCYNRALVLDPENALPWSLKGTAFSDLGRPIEASECYMRAGEIETRICPGIKAGLPCLAP